MTQTLSLLVVTMNKTNMFWEANRASLMSTYVKITSSKDHVLPTQWPSWNWILSKSSSHYVLDVYRQMWSVNATHFSMYRVDTSQVRPGRQRNPAAFTLVAKLRWQPKNFHPSTSSMAARTHMCSSHFTASLRTNSSWAPQSHTFTAESATYTNTPFFIILCFGRPVNHYNLDAVGLIRMKCVAVSHLFTWLQKQRAMHVDSKNRWFAAKADKRENTGRKYGTCTE